MIFKEIITVIVLESHTRLIKPPNKINSDTNISSKSRPQFKCLWRQLVLMYRVKDNIWSKVFFRPIIWLHLAKTIFQIGHFLRLSKTNSNISGKQGKRKHLILRICLIYFQQPRFLFKFCWENILHQNFTAHEFLIGAFFLF